MTTTTHLGITIPEMTDEIADYHAQWAAALIALDAAIGAPPVNWVPTIHSVNAGGWTLNEALSKHFGKWLWVMADAGYVGGIAPGNTTFDLPGGLTVVQDTPIVGFLGGVPTKAIGTGITVAVAGVPTGSQHVQFSGLIPVTT